MGKGVKKPKHILHGLDNEIRTTDMPERMQLRSTPVTSVPEGAEEELDREAEWIFR